MSRISKLNETYPRHKGAINKLSKKDPSKNNKYLEWMAKQAVALNIRGATSRKLKDIIDHVDKFHKRIDQLEIKDLYQYDSLGKLKDALKKTTPTKSERENEQKSYYKLHETDKLLVAIPANEEGAKKLFANTRWCISNMRTFKNYHNRGDRFIVIIDKEEEKTNSKGRFSKFALQCKTKCRNGIINRNVNLLKIIFGQTKYEQAVDLFNDARNKKTKDSNPLSVVQWWDASDHSYHKNSVLNHFIKKHYNLDLDEIRKKAYITLDGKPKKEHSLKFLEIILTDKSSSDDLILAIDEMDKHNKSVYENLKKNNFSSVSMDFDKDGNFDIKTIPTFCTLLILEHPNCNASVVKKMIEYLSFDKKALNVVSGVKTFNRGVFKYPIPVKDNTHSRHSYYYKADYYANNENVNASNLNVYKQHLLKLYGNSFLGNAGKDFADALEAIEFLTKLFLMKKFIKDKEIVKILPDCLFVNHQIIERKLYSTDEEFIETLEKIKDEDQSTYKKIFKKYVTDNKTIRTSILEKLADKSNDFKLYSHPKFKKTAIKKVINSKVKKCLEDKDFIRAEVFVDSIKSNPNYDIKIAQKLMDMYPDSEKRVKTNIRKWIKAQIKAGND